MAGAPYGNKNAEKWTFEESEKLLNKALEICNQKTDYIVYGNKVKGYEFDFIGEVACQLQTYHHNITRDIPRRHKELKPLVNRLLAYMERNCYSNTKKGIIKEATGIVNLKSNHKWTDRNESNNKNENKTTIIVQDSKTKDELDKLIDEND
jgi:hypothetical protein